MAQARQSSWSAVGGRLNTIRAVTSSPARQTDDICSEPGEGEQGEADDGELEEGEELEDGEISDEDEALKTERLEPKPVCRFFSKGQCTWGQSCRLVFRKDIHKERAFPP